MSRTEVGYTGGHKEDPTYKETCTGTTGHAEAVQLEFDPAVVSYARLLDIFFDKHDPTTKDRQGGDIGSQYRSAIFYHSPEQVSSSGGRQVSCESREQRTVADSLCVHCRCVRVPQKSEAEQRVAAEEKKLGKPVVTEIAPIGKW